MIIVVDGAEWSLCGEYDPYQLTNVFILICNCKIATAANQFQSILHPIPSNLN